ncbi:MAG: homocysteine S-methyltransferase family protein [Candidatus Latescibacteria bacterium]|nr:homocysteine S-methyltransferase family protein [Candidatus Latescibacterota bacterium]
MSLTTFFKGKKILVSDGAWGTEMAKKGLEPGECPELLNADNPGMVREIASSYAEAGADIVITNTFGANPFKLAKFGIENRTEELNEKGVYISVEAVNNKSVIFASIGPTGEFLAPLGLVSEKEMVKAFSRQVRSFVKAGAHGVVVETMTDLGEVICALKAVKENSDLPVICSMTFDKGLKGYATMMGVKPDEAASKLEDAGADGIGSNCGSGIGNMIEVAAIMRPVTDLPLWFKPNAGLPELVDGITVFRETPEHMAKLYPALIDAGANIIGGCCGTTPDHIRLVRKIVDSIK